MSKITGTIYSWKQRTKGNNQKMTLRVIPLANLSLTVYNTVCCNTALDITWIRVGPQMAIKDSFSYVTCAFCSRYNTVWIANTEIGLDPKIVFNIKRLWFTVSFESLMSQCANHFDHLGFLPKIATNHTGNLARSHTDTWLRKTEK